MFFIRNMTIRRKLTSIMMFTCVAALLLAGAAFMAWEWTALRRDLAENISTHAGILADNCKAAVAFEDAQDAGETLKALRVQPSVIYGCIHNKDGENFATYHRDGPDAAVEQIHHKKEPAEHSKEGHKFSDGALTVIRHIVLDDEVIGTVYIHSDLSPIHARLKRDIAIILAVVVVSSLLAYFLSAKLQTIISQPILDLAQVTRVVSEKRDYSNRAEKRSNDEVGTLIDGFNEMLEQIQERDVELVQAKVQLERRVEERTAELSFSNTKLQEEIAVRKTVERRQLEIMTKLESANQELKDFAYIVSHDLKAPLRGIKTLTEWLLADYADKLDDNGTEQMQLLSNRVDRMHSLIEGILQYSRVGRVKEKQVQVNLDELVPEIVDMLAPPENISITIEDQLPVIEFEPTRIRQVFQNLLSNAIKYMDKPQGQITISCTTQDDLWRFSIADNGPGIEERHFTKIFQMFQTLSPRDEFESTGVGLTVIKKIVEMYSGQIWVESEVGEGSTFFFTLPIQNLEAQDAKLEANIAC